jgi:uncharacterized protein (DUF427 family)
MAAIKRDVPRPGQESVWDYPRPPRVEACSRRIRVVFHGETIADSVRTYRLLETSHPPTYYIPMSDIRMEYLHPGQGSSFCEFKGAAGYWDLEVRGRHAASVAWSYPAPTARYALLRDHLAFYIPRVDECFVDEERAQPQPGGFYGGWVTSDLAGPFKGGPGSGGW